ncbi:terminase large subunit domain-containing protein [Rothia kristinae]
MAGPKKRITAEPLDVEGYPAGRAERRLAFIREHVITPRGVGAREPFNVRGFQEEIVRGAFAEGVQQALVSMPRGNGKSGLAAALGVAELWVGDYSAEVLVVASDERQARIVFDQARRMVELNPALAERVHVYQDRLYVPETDSTLRPLPADYNALQGWDPSLLICDELHTWTEDIWSAATSAAGKRAESLLLAISTPGKSRDSLMWRLVEHARRTTDPAFYLREFAAPEGCEVMDREAWRVANPALADPEPFMQEKALEAVAVTLREPVFRQLRLGQWAGQVDSWLPFGAWDALADEDRVVEPGTRIVLGFDGSTSGDSTALVGCTIEEHPHLFVAGVWEKPTGPAGRSWRVPRREVSERVHELFSRFDVRELACDPWGWVGELEAWAAEHGARRVISWPTSYRKRMAPATDRLYGDVMEQRLSHDGNPRLAAHVGNAVAVSTPQGDVIVKDKKGSSRKIDLAVAAIVARDRAAFHAQKKRGRVVVHTS